jgi:acyl carrier protein phosphodiesterase
MNWLAHLYLSDSSPEFRLGNLLPDLLRPVEIQRLPGEFLAGVACHRRIDAFTDRHLAVWRSKQRIGGDHRRYAGIIVDVFYDHLLAKNWSRHMEMPLAQFTEEIYASFHELSPRVPVHVRERLAQMRAEDWLGCYREVAGVRLTLQRIAARLRRPAELGSAADALEQHGPAFEEDFDVFFPELCAHIRPFVIPSAKVGSDT